MIGLKKGTVIIKEYNSNWKNQFEEEKKSLQEIFGDIAITIEHIGSTSIEGISAKPIIDIAIGINKLNDFEKVRTKIISNKNYSVREENPEGEILVRKGTLDYTTYLIHVMEYKSERYQNTIVFRDYLRKNKEDKIKYGDLKKELAKKNKDNREMYTASKNDFIQDILRKAKRLEKFMIEIKFDKKGKKSVAYDGNLKVGVCEFIEEEGYWNIIHTEVDDSHQGKGIARKLVENIIENSKKYNKNIKADCSYAKKVIENYN